MRSRWTRGLAALAVALPAVACDAIFGIQDLPDNTTGPDGSTGAQGPDGSGMMSSGDGGGNTSPEGSTSENDGGGPDSPGTMSNGDSGADTSPVDAAPPVLSCTSWANASPVVLEDLSVDASEGSSYVGEIFVGEGTANQVHVIAGLNSGQRIYFHDTSANTTTTLDDTAVFLGGSPAYLYARPYSFDAGTGAIILDQVATHCGVGCGHVQLDYALLPSTATGDAGPALGYLGGPTNEALSLYGAAAIPFANGAVYGEFAEYASSSYTAYVDNTTSDAGGAVSAALALVDNFQFPTLVHAGSSVYLFASNDPSTLGTAVYTFTDDGLVASQATPRPFSSGVTARFSDVAPSVSGTSTNIAYYETADGGVTIRAGSVPSSSLGTVTSSNLVSVRTYADATQVPISGARAEWYGDDIMFLGGTAPPDGGVSYGANLLWIDANGYVRAEQVGMNEVLGDRQGIVEIVAAPSSVSPTSARWDVAWIEQRVGYQVLLYNQLICN